LRPVRRPHVSVIGPGTCTEEERSIAESVGRLLAERGAVLVCGGGGGVMEAACRGAMMAGGLTVGVLPSAEPGAGNAYLTVALPTGLGEARNALVAQAGSAVIAVGCGYGTLSEIGLALKAQRKVIGLRTWQLRTADGESAELVAKGTPEEAVEYALSGATE